jgi:hypothetical protein
MAGIVFDQVDWDRIALYSLRWTGKGVKPNRSNGYKNVAPFEFGRNKDGVCLRNNYI